MRNHGLHEVDPDGCYMSEKARQKQTANHPPADAVVFPSVERFRVNGLGFRV